MPNILTSNLSARYGTAQADIYFPNGSDKILSVPRIIQYSVLQEDDGQTSGQSLEVVTRGEIEWKNNIDYSILIPSAPSNRVLSTSSSSVDSTTGALKITAIYSYSSTPIFTFGSYAYNNELYTTLSNAGIGGGSLYYIIYGSDHNVYGLTTNWNNCCPLEIGGFCASTDGLTLYDYSSFYLDDNWGSTVSAIFSNGDTSAISQLPFGVSNVQELGAYIYNHLS